MKNSKILFYLLIIMLIVSFVNSTIAMKSDQQNGKVPSREANAKKQLLDHQRFLDSAAQKSKLKLPTVNTSQTPFQFKKLQSSSTIFFQDDMESGTNGWTVVSPSDSAAWHLSTRSYNSWSHSWHAGTESGTYQTDARVYDELISPQINLSGAIGQVTLLFAEYYQTELGWDFCMVDITTDGGTNWTHLRGGYGESVSGDCRGQWKFSSLDLTPYTNQTVNLRFVFDTGDSLYNFFEGWYIDNIIVFDQTAWITGIVFFDQNHNGIYDAGESGIGDFFFPLIDRPITMGLTRSSDGTFSLPLPLGMYHMVLTPPYFHIPYFQPWITTTPDTLNVDLNMPGQINTINVGYYRPPCILSGRVFQDLNHNGVYNAGEPAFREPVVELEDVNFQNLGQTHWLDQTQADSTGQFSFQVFVKNWELPPPGQNYWIAEYGVPIIWIPTTPDVFSHSPKYFVGVGSRDTLLTGFNFGSYLSSQTENGTIKGCVFNDLNQNGVKDSLEPMISHCNVMLITHNTDPDLGNINGTTDSLGNFSFTGLPSGRYAVRLYGYGGLPYGWQQSFPASPFTDYYFQLGSDEVRDSVIFGMYHLSVGTVCGHIFYDMNRNGIEDPGERYPQPSVTIYGPNEQWSLPVIADLDGNYSVDTIPIGVHTISIGLPGGTSKQQWRSIPPNPVVFTLTPSETVTVNWSIYQIVAGSISGSVYNDVDGNGTHDPGEPPIKGATVYLRIQYPYGNDASTTSDDSGRFRFNVFTGQYAVRLAMAAGWRQTQPDSFKQYNVNLGDEDNQTGFNFGVTRDSLFHITFRTFLPESLATDVYDNLGRLLKPMPTKPVACDETFTLVTPIGGLNGLHVEFNTYYALTMTATHFPSPTMLYPKYKWEFRMNGEDTLAAGDSVIIFAHLGAGKMFRITKYWWEEGTGGGPAEGTMVGRQEASQMTLLYAMPNLMNVFQYNSRTPYGKGGVSLTVGVPGPHSVTLSTKSYKNIWTSLTDLQGNMHKGPPRCLDASSFRRTVNKYLPTLGNNILFAEALALKASIVASDYQITPYGLGGLIFRGDSTNPFNGLSIRKIATKLDTAMSAYVEPTTNPPADGHCVCDSQFFNTAYRTIRMIDSAFSGPIDTIGPWYLSGEVLNAGICLKPVRSLFDVPFLALDSNFYSIAVLGSGAYVEEPLQYKLDQNYPNPFNPTTIISFTLLQESFVTLKIYNILGQEVATLINREQMDEGTQEIEFNASSLPSGVYIYRIKAEGIADEENEIAAQTFVAVKKMVLLK